MVYLLDIFISLFTSHAGVKLLNVPVCLMFDDRYGKKLRLECVTTDHRQHIRVTFAKSPEEVAQMEKEKQKLQFVSSLILFFVVSE